MCFYLYGELKVSRKISLCAGEKLVRQKKIETIGDFLEVIKPFTGKDKEKKFLAQVFQALRIEVNDEMRALKEMLRSTLRVLRPGGRLVVITYHSLEDRLVKNFLKTGNFEGKCEQDFFGNVRSPFRLVNNKVIVPTDEEVERNPRSRSAKLRIAEKVIRRIDMEETDNIRNEEEGEASFVLVYTRWRRAKEDFILRHTRMIVLLVVLAFFFIGNRYTCMQKLREIDRLVSDKYVGELDADNVADYAAAGYITGLGDKWSSYIPAENYEAYRMSGEGKGLRHRRFGDEHRDEYSRYARVR